MYCCSVYFVVFDCCFCYFVLLYLVITLCVFVLFCGFVLLDFAWWVDFGIA